MIAHALFSELNTSEIHEERRGIVDGQRFTGFDPRQAGGEVIWCASQGDGADKQFKAAFDTQLSEQGGVLCGLLLFVRFTRPLIIPLRGDPRQAQPVKRFFRVKVVAAGCDDFYPALLVAVQAEQWRGDNKRCLRLFIFHEDL